MSERDHAYRARLVWDGNLGDGTAKYETYGRQHRLLFGGKPGIEATADPAFRGDPARLNPEDLLVGALASCHMLSYLALCARSRIRVLAYEDDAHGVMREDGRGGGQCVKTVHACLPLSLTARMRAAWLRLRGI